MAKKQGDVAKWLIIIGFFLAIISSLMPQLDWAIWLSVLLGLAGGYFMVGDVKTFLAALLLTTAPLGLAQIPTFGIVLRDVLMSIGVFFGMLMIIPALKVVFKKVDIGKMVKI